MGDRTESLASGAHERESVIGNTPGTENIFRIVMRKRKNELGHDDGNQDKLSKSLPEWREKNERDSYEERRSSGR